MPQCDYKGQRVRHECSNEAEYEISAKGAHCNSCHTHLNQVIKTICTDDSVYTVVVCPINGRACDKRP